MLGTNRRRSYSEEIPSTSSFRIEDMLEDNSTDDLSNIGVVSKTSTDSINNNTNNNDTTGTNHNLSTTTAHIDATTAAEIADRLAAQQQRRQQSRIFDDPSVTAGYQNVPLLEMTKLPRGGISVDTKAVGRVQVRIALFYLIRFYTMYTHQH